MKNPITKLRIDQFENLLNKLKKYSQPKNEDEETILIKNFEISFELIVKTITVLYLSFENNPLPSKKELIFWALKFKLIKNPISWIDIWKLRNKTVHEYLADEIYQHLSKIINFIPEIIFFVTKIKTLYEKEKTTML